MSLNPLARLWPPVVKGDTITQPAGNTGALNWSYDPFGNRQSQTGSGSLSFSMTQMQASYQASNSNRMDNVNYDASGNVLSDPVAGPSFYSYDAGSRLLSAGTVCYVYNAEGIRTAKGNAMQNGVCSGITAQYLLGPGGEQVTELAGQPDNPVWAHTNVFGGGKLLATYDNAGTHFHFTDWLGTMRAQVNADGTVEETCLSLPFGDSLSCSGPGSDATEHHFTGKERDAESGLDYFGARYFQSNAGRWMSPDWAAKAEPIPYAKMGWPQSLNLYAYVGNNPLTMADADGHCGQQAPISCGDSSVDAKADKDAGAVQEEKKQEAAAEDQKAQPPQQQNATQASDNTSEAQNNTSPPPGRTPAQGGKPDSTVEIPDGKGGKTVRKFGPDGKAETDIDHGHDHGAGDPHVHDWEWGKKPPRQPGRPLTPEEQKNVKRAAGGVTAGVIIYWVVSEASRILFPPRNLIPVP